MSLKRAFWVVFALTVANYLAMLFWSLPRLAVNGMFPFDLRPAGYSGDEARAYLSALGTDQRAFYSGVQHKLDTLYPGLMAASLVLAYHLLFPRRAAWGLGLVAVAAATFDWLENASVSAMLRVEPQALTDAMIATASGWTVWKSSTVPVALGILIVGLVRRWWLKRRAA